MTIELSLGCKRYPWIEPLIRGDVEPTGIDLTVIHDYISPEYFTRMLDHQEFDAAELSLGAYLAAMERPEYDLTAIPVFPHRRFRHSFLYVRKGAPFETPSDLNGRSIGMTNWQSAVGLWVRGTLQERHGLDLASVDWRTTSPEVVPMETSETYSVSDVPPRRGASASTGGAQGAPDEPIEEGGTGALRTLERRLVTGELDAVITPTEFRNDDVERIFSNPFDVERAYYEETGIFPINHLIVVRDDYLDDHPWAANKLYEAFDDALEETVAEFREPGWFKRSPLVWSLESVEEQLAVFDDSPWEYGLTDRNRTALEKAVQYATDHEIIEDEYAIEDLFVNDVGR